MNIVLNFRSILVIIIIAAIIFVWLVFKFYRFVFLHCLNIDTGLSSLNGIFQYNWNQRIAAWKFFNGLMNSDIILYYYNLRLNGNVLLLLFLISGHRYGSSSAMNKIGFCWLGNSFLSPRNSVTKFIWSNKPTTRI